jgi:hypothetical protein
MAAAVLTIDINARLAKLEEGLTQANRRLAGFQSTVSGLGNSLKNALGGIGIGAAVAKFVSLTKAAIDSADHLNDLSQTTGIAAVTLGGIGFAASQAGSSLDSMLPALNKLNVAIAEAEQGNAKAATAFGVLGINVRDSSGKVKDAGQVLVELAAKFETFEDGPRKAALANELFKKGFGELVPLLNEGSESLRKNIEYFRRYSGLTDDVVARSDAFNDELTKINLLSSAFFRHLAGELLPSLQSFSTALLDAEEKAGGFKGAAAEVATVLRGAAVVAVFTANAFKNLGTSIGGAAAQLELIGKFEFSKARALGKELAADLERSKAERDKLIDAILHPPSASVTAKKPKGIQPPGLPNEDATKNLRDAQIKALEDSIRDEQALLSTRERFLAAYYQDDQISIREFYAARQRVQSEALQKQLAAADAEIAIRRKFLATASGSDRVKAEGDLEEAIRKRANLEEQASIKGQEDWLQAERAVKAFRDEVEETSVALLEMAGNDRVAAAIARFEFANRDKVIKLKLQLDSPNLDDRRLAEIGLANIAAQREQITNQAQLNEAMQRFGDLTTIIGNAQSRINIARNAGSLTELEALRAQGDANRALIPILERQAELYEEIARKSSDPRALLAADQLRLKIQELASTSDLVAKKFNDLFVDSFSSALEKITEKGAKFKDIINALEKDLVAGISRIASRNIAETLFKPENFGGLGKIFGDLFGGKSKAGEATGAAALTGAGTTLTSAGSLLTTAGTLLQVSATSLQAAAATLSASSSLSSAAMAGIPGLGSAGTFGGGFFNPFEGIIGFASGTTFARGGLAMVGEQGRELVRIPRGAQVYPNDRTEKILAGSGQAVSVHAPITISVQGVPNTRTANQIGIEAYRGITRAASRIG